MPVPAIEHGIRCMSHGQGSHSDSIKRDTLGLPAPVGMRHDNTPHTWHHALQPVTQANGKWLTSQWQLQKMLCHNQRAVLAHRPLLPPTGQCIGRVCPFNERLSGPHGSRIVEPFAVCILYLVGLRVVHHAGCSTEAGVGALNVRLVLAMVVVGWHMLHAKPIVVEWRLMSTHPLVLHNIRWCTHTRVLSCPARTGWSSLCQCRAGSAWLQPPSRSFSARCLIETLCILSFRP